MGLIRGEGTYCKKRALVWGLIRGGLNRREGAKSTINGISLLIIGNKASKMVSEIF